MKIALISPYYDITSIGIRIISSLLKGEGHRVTFVLMPDFKGDDLYIGKRRYSDVALYNLSRLLRDVDMVGITVMTNFLDASIEITRSIKRYLQVPVIWGGVHPTVLPGESLLHADMICMGEGEEAMVELLEALERGRDPSGIPNTGHKRDGKVILNPPRPLIQDLDSLPFPDYSLDSHFVLTEEGLEPVSEDILREGMARITFGPMLKRVVYQSMSGRGCPHACSYCWNMGFRKMHRGERYLRWRSIENFVSELSEMKRRFPYINFINISDDTFFARRDEEIEEFARLYRRDVGEPFFCLSSPVFVSERKVKTLVDAGLILLQIGFESGSTSTLATYNRKGIRMEQMLRSAQIANKFRERLLPQYDFLLDNPFETDEDRKETVRFILNLPDPKIVQTFSIRLYPGTELYERARREGLIGEDLRLRNPGGNSRLVGNYYHFLLRMLSKGNVPAGLIKVLASDPFQILLAREGLYPLYYRLSQSLRALYWTKKRNILKYV